MNAKLKPCPFCGVTPTVKTFGVNCQNPECDMHSENFFTVEMWNNRPQEQKLKDAIARLLRAVSLSYDEAFSRRTVNARFKEAEKEVQKILGIDKAKK